jgi:hypothetical protein
MQTVEIWSKSAWYIDYPIWRNRFTASTPLESDDESLAAALRWFMRAMTYVSREDVTQLIATSRPYGQAYENPPDATGVIAYPDGPFFNGLKPVQTITPEWFGLSALMPLAFGNKGRHWFFAALNEEDIIRNSSGGYYLKDQTAHEEALSVWFHGMLSNAGWTLHVPQLDRTHQEQAVSLPSSTLTLPQVVQAKTRHAQYMAAPDSGKQAVDTLMLQLRIIHQLEKNLVSFIHLDNPFGALSLADDFGQVQQSAVQCLSGAVAWLKTTDAQTGPNETSPATRFGPQSFDAMGFACGALGMIQAQTGPYAQPDFPKWKFDADGQEYYNQETQQQILEEMQKYRKIAAVISQFDYLTHLKNAGKLDCNN